jgi:hypothetical protein
MTGWIAGHEDDLSVYFAFAYGRIGSDSKRVGKEGNFSIRSYGCSDDRE